MLFHFAITVCSTDLQILGVAQINWITVLGLPSVTLDLSTLIFFKVKTIYKQKKWQIQNCISYYKQYFFELSCGLFYYGTFVLIDFKVNKILIYLDHSSSLGINLFSKTITKHSKGQMMSYNTSR